MVWVTDKVSDTEVSKQSSKLTSILAYVRSFFFQQQDMELVTDTTTDTIKEIPVIPASTKSLATDLIATATVTLLDMDTVTATATTDLLINIYVQAKYLTRVFMGFLLLQPYILTQKLNKEW